MYNNIFSQFKCLQILISRYQKVYQNYKTYQSLNTYIQF